MKRELKANDEQCYVHGTIYKTKQLQPCYLPEEWSG